MSLEIKRLWADTSKPFEDQDWKEVVVISIFKSMVTVTSDNVTQGAEQLFALGYYPETGELVEQPLNECIIKELYDKESRNVTNFSAPVIKTGAAGKEDR